MFESAIDTHIRNRPAVPRLRLLGHKWPDDCRLQRRLELAAAPRLDAVPHRQLLLQCLQSQVRQSLVVHNDRVTACSMHMPCVCFAHAPSVIPATGRGHLEQASGKPGAASPAPSP